MFNLNKNDKVLHSFSYEGLEHSIEDSDTYNAETSQVESGATFSFSCSNATTVLVKEYKNFAIECFNGNWYNMSQEPPGNLLESIDNKTDRK